MSSASSRSTSLISSPMFENSPSSSRTSSLASSRSKSSAPPSFPAVTLPIENLDHDLAAQICMSILGHTLYLNGQLPFPVHSLGRLNLNHKTHARAFKKRADFLSTTDTLTCHLPSTFQALSWALASNESILPPDSQGATTSTHIVLVTGPTPSTVKARFIVELDGLLVQRQKQMANDVADDDTTPRPSEIARNDDPDDHNTSFQSFTSDMSNALSEISTADSSFSTQDSEGSFSASSSLEDSEDDEDEADEAVRLSQQQEHVRAVGLAMATGLDFNREDIAPTQTYILLRAPRGFKHPSWLPKQALSKTLDARISAFFDEQAPAPATTNTRKGPVEEGIRVSTFSPATVPLTQTSGNEHEMIWWQWNAGALRGFEAM